MRVRNGRFKELLKHVWKLLATYGLWLLSRIVISNMEEFQKAPPKFKLGDLVKIRNLGLLFAQYEGAQAEFGLISCEAYHYTKTSTKDLLLFGWWTYDVLIDGQLIRMMPETFLEEVKLDEDKDIKRE